MRADDLPDIGMLDVEFADAVDAELSKEFPATEKELSMAMPQENPREETPFDRLNDALQRLHEAEEHLSGLTDKLLGQKPPEPTTAGKLASVPSGGVFGNVDSVAQRMSALAEQVVEHTNRISRQIP